MLCEKHLLQLEPKVHLTWTKRAEISIRELHRWGGGWRGGGNFCVCPCSVHTNMHDTRLWLTKHLYGHNPHASISSNLLICSFFPHSLSSTSSAVTTPGEFSPSHTALCHIWRKLRKSVGNTFLTTLCIIHYKVILKGNFWVQYKLNSIDRFCGIKSINIMWFVPVKKIYSKINKV